MTGGQKSAKILPSQGLELEELLFVCSAQYGELQREYFKHPRENRLAFTVTKLNTKQLLFKTNKLHHVQHFKAVFPYVDIQVSLTTAIQGFSDSGETFLQRLFPQSSTTTMYQVHWYHFGLMSNLTKEETCPYVYCRYQFTFCR